MGAHTRVRWRLVWFAATGWVSSCWCLPACLAGAVITNVLLSRTDRDLPERVYQIRAGPPDDSLVAGMGSISASIVRSRVVREPTLKTVPALGGVSVIKIGLSKPGQQRLRFLDFAAQLVVYLAHQRMLHCDPPLAKQPSEPLG